MTLTCTNAEAVMGFADEPTTKRKTTPLIIVISDELTEPNPDMKPMRFEIAEQRDASGMPNGLFSIGLHRDDPAVIDVAPQDLETLIDALVDTLDACRRREGGGA